MITNDGYRIIALTGIVLVVVFVAALLTESMILMVLAALTGVIFIFHFFFFRDPEREIPQNNRAIISPADGKIIKVERVTEDKYHQGNVQLVSIFMSVFDVHVNRVPVSGNVELVEYKKGKYLAAYADAAMDQNEQTWVGIQSEYGKVLFKQIAGLIARRIVCRLKQGESVAAGERFGMIKYSSRVDVFLPSEVNLKVKLGDKVSAGSTLLGEFST